MNSTYYLHQKNFPSKFSIVLLDDATALLYSLSVNILDPKVPKKSLSSAQDGYLNTPSHLRRDENCLDRTQRVPKRLCRVSICIKRSHSSRNSIAAICRSHFSRGCKWLGGDQSNELLCAERGIGLVVDHYFLCELLVPLALDAKYYYWTGHAQ